MKSVQLMTKSEFLAGCLETKFEAVKRALDVTLTRLADLGRNSLPICIAAKNLPSMTFDELNRVNSRLSELGWRLTLARDGNYFELK